MKQKQNEMLQRVQTLYLIGAFLVSGILPYFLPLWKDENGVNYYATYELPIAILFAFSAALSLLSIFSYRKRQQQFVTGRFNIILNVILFGLCLFYAFDLSGEAEVSEKGIGLALPVVAIILLVFGNKFIKKDEKLVKGVNRLR